MLMPVGFSSKTVYRLTSGFIFVGISLFSVGCVYDPFFYGPPRHSEYRPQIYDYYYYPSVRVYFHFTSGYYYYRDRNRWIKTRVLPRRIQIDSKDRVRIRVDADKPTIKHKDHVRIYKPKPDYRVDKKRNIKEREANKIWYQDYEKRKFKSNKKSKEKDKQKR